MADDQKRKTYGGAATAVGGGALATGVPAVSRSENLLIRHRLKRHDAKIAAVQAAIPARPPRGGRQQAARQGHTTEKFSPGQKAAFSQSRKAAYRKLDELKVARKAIAKPKVFPHQSKLWIGALAAGVPLSYAGARHQVKQNQLSKKMDRHDVNAAYAGGAGAGIAYQGGVMLTKPIDWHNEKKIRSSAKHSATMAAHNEKYRPKKGPAMTAGDPRYRAYFRNYPKSLPGGRLKRAFAVSHTGRSGTAITAGLVGAGAAGSVALNRKRRARMDVSKAYRYNKNADPQDKRNFHLGGAATSAAGVGAALHYGYNAHRRGMTSMYREAVKHPEKFRTTEQGIKQGLKHGALGWGRHLGTTRGKVAAGVYGTALAAGIANKQRAKKKNVLVKKGYTVSAFGINHGI